MHTVHKKRKQNWLGRLAVGAAGAAAMPTAPLPTVCKYISRVYQFRVVVFVTTNVRFHEHFSIRSILFRAHVRLRFSSLVIGCDCVRVFITFFIFQLCINFEHEFSYMKNCSCGTSSAAVLAATMPSTTTTPPKRLN